MNRDVGIHEIRERPGRICSGMGLGVMLFEENYPAFPGDVRNPSGYRFPIQYDVIAGVTIEKVVYDNHREECLPEIIASARRLQRIGCRAIVSECGYLACFQREVAKAVDVPAFMSSLLQVPVMQHVVGVGNGIGILCASRSRLTDIHLSNVGVSDMSGIKIAGIFDDYEAPAFASLWQPGATSAQSKYNDAETQIVKICSDFITRHPTIRALLLECAGFQPFARSIQRRVDLPVFSWSTLLDFAYSVVSHRDHYGHV